MSAASRYKSTAPQRERRRVAQEIANLELGAAIVCGMCHGLGFDLDDVACDADGCETFEVSVGIEGREQLVSTHDAGPNCEARCTICEGYGSGRHVFMLAILSDPRQGFDVARAREHAASLIALEAEQDRFEAWANTDPPRPIKPVNPRHLPRIWEEMGFDRRAPVGRSLARLGRAIQRALKGQPSECQGQCWERTPGRAHQGGGDCPDCAGSGHNLRGVLPPVEWSAQLVAAVADSQRSGTEPPGRTSWTRAAYDNYGDLRAIVDALPIPGEPSCAGHGRARVAPRGTHRDDQGGSGWAVWPAAAWWGQAPGPRRPGHWSDRYERDWQHLPRWRRGELRHAEQRRKRAHNV